MLTLCARLSHTKIDHVHIVDTTANNSFQNALGQKAQHNHQPHLANDWAALFAQTAISFLLHKTSYTHIMLVEIQKIVQWLVHRTVIVFYVLTWTNLTVILADTQSIAINAKAACQSRNPDQQQSTIIARTLTSPWHSTKSSTNSSI